MKTNTIMVEHLNEYMEQQTLIEHRSFVFKNIHDNLEKITTVLEDLTNLSDKIEDYSVKHKLINKMFLLLAVKENLLELNYEIKKRVLNEQQRT